MHARLTESPRQAVARALAGHVPGIAIRTSGSTGLAREVLVDTPALVASAEATHEALGGPGTWLLAVPADRIAGAMVWVRSMLAGTMPTAMPPGPFTASGFAHATQALVSSGKGPLYVSLVPTQLRRLVNDPAGRQALAMYRTVLVGGAPLSDDEAPINVVRTYGATETCGGCIYDGTAIGDARVQVVDGRVRIAGSMLARGYADGENSAFTMRDGQRWWVTSDVGTLDDHGQLNILGRADDAINTGAVKVHPATVEEALRQIEGIENAVVTSLPHLEWGEQVVALVTVGPRLSAVASVPDLFRSTLGGTVPREAIPRRVWVIDTPPLLESGKIDRSAARRIAAQFLDEDQRYGEGEQT